jgi:hypothetical protein
VVAGSNPVSPTKKGSLTSLSKYLCSSHERSATPRLSREFGQADVEFFGELALAVQDA